MDKIKSLFKRKVLYNTLFLGILSVTTVIRLSVFPENNIWIMNIPAAILRKLFTGTDTLIKNIVFEKPTLYISHSIFASMLLLFILSCILYIMKKPKAYCAVTVIQCIMWGLLIGIANFTAVQFFANVTGAVAICTPIIALVVFFIVNTVRVKNEMIKKLKTEKENDNG